MNATATMTPAGPQYMRALERANKVRLARADLKRRVANGEVDVAGVILECPWEAESMTVADLLMSQRRWGESRCRKFLAMVPMSETKTVGSMTDRQRGTLARMLADAAGRRRREAAVGDHLASPDREHDVVGARRLEPRAGGGREPVLVGG
ncbi:MAG TPA: hypothetical protein VMU32_00595 [Solirubrobacteraceae bacterium]|nr:hypothetical protein [Solirubrobacteraceae bacterium]